MSASPVELVRMLYGAARQAVGEARRHLAACEPAARSRQISRAMEILAELSSTLDGERGGAIARDLAEIYDYLQRRLVDANVRQEDGPLAEVQQLLTTLAGAWDQVAGWEQPALQAEVAAAAPPAPRRPERAPAGYGAFIGEPSLAMAGQSWSA